MEDSNRPTMIETSTSRKKIEKTIQYAFRPIYIMLKIGSLHTGLKSRSEQKNTKTETVRNALHIIYCAVIGLWMSLNTARQLYQFQAISNLGITGSLAPSIATILYFASFAIVLPVSLWKLSRCLDGLLNGLHSFIESTGTTINVIGCRRMASVLMISYMCVTIAVSIEFTLSMRFVDHSNVTSPLLQVYDSFGMFGGDRLPLVALVTWSLVQSTLNSAITIALMTLFIFFVYILAKCMNCLSQNIDVYITEGLSDSLLRKYRGEFETLVQFLQQYNSCVTFYCGTVYLLGLVVPCMMLYGIAHDQLSSDDLRYSISFILCVGFNLVVFSGAAIALITTMHKPLDSLYRMNTESLSEKGVQELSLFISRLSGSPIGVSVYGLFVIDTSTVLMLIGTLATYAVVVLQFQPTVTTSDA